MSTKTLPSLTDPKVQETLAECRRMLEGTTLMLPTFRHLEALMALVEEGVYWAEEATAAGPETNPGIALEGHARFARRYLSEAP